MTEEGYSVAAPFAHSSGPRDASIALVGEAWGKEEEIVGMPFMGQAGQELTRLLRDAGIARSDCFMTNVLAFRPPDNNLLALCASKKDAGYEGAALGLRAISPSKYLRSEFLPEVGRLREELDRVNPNLVVALGNTACWALLGSSGIGTLRGVVATGSLGPWKVLPTYHPAAVLRNWEWRTITVADLLKCERERHFPEIRRPKRFVLVDPTLDEIRDWCAKLLPTASAIAVDIETTGSQIDCIGFAVSATQAMVVPFFDARYTGGSYWRSQDEELCAWDIVRSIMESEVPKIFQNGIFDLQYIPRLGITPRACYEDTMLLHHSHYPELKKGLGFLGSLYTNEASWKLMRSRGEDQLKRDE